MREKNCKKVIDRINGGNGDIISVEIEPPFSGKGIGDVFDVLDPLVNLGVSYIDITYHPQQIIGYDRRLLFWRKKPIFQRKKPGTLGVSVAIRDRYRDVEPVPHVICSGFTANETEELLIDLDYMGISNILALKGAPRKGPNNEFMPFKQEGGGHGHANELIEQIVNYNSDFCIGTACYPEGHIPGYLEGPILADPVGYDLPFLKLNIEAGAEYLVTQMFFDNEFYLRFVDRVRKSGIDVPVVPGLMPIYWHSHLKTLPGVFGASVPEKLVEQVERFKDDKEAIKQVGVEWCIEQCLDLRKEGVPSLHLFASRGSPVKEVIKAIK